MDEQREFILNAAIELFSFYGYENVTMKAIAEHSAVELCCISKHFRSKKQILNEIYEYYETCFFDNCSTNEEELIILKAGTAKEIVKLFTWSFYGMPHEKHCRMTMITKIVYSRFIIDDQANNLFCHMMVDQSIARGERALQMLIQLGRLKPDTDIKSLMEMCSYVCLMIGITGISESFRNGTVDKKDALREMLATFLFTHMMEPEGNESSAIQRADGAICKQKSNPGPSEHTPCL